MNEYIETKRGTTPGLTLELVGLDVENLASVEFLFKQKLKESAEPLLRKVYQDEPSDSAIFADGLFFLPMSEADSRLFKADDTYFIDTRVVYADGGIPQTEIVQVYSLPTLFAPMTKEEDEDDE